MLTLLVYKVLPAGPQGLQRRFAVPPNNQVERTASSRTLTAAAHRERWAANETRLDWRP